MKQTLMNMRVLFIRSSCPHCLKMSKYIEKINIKLPLDKRIKVIDCVYYDYFGVITDPLIFRMKKYVKSYPTLLFEGFKLDSVVSESEIREFLKGLLHEDLTFDEENEYMFDGSNCKIVNKKLFGTEIICEEK